MKHILLFIFATVTYITQAQLSGMDFNSPSSSSTNSAGTFSCNAYYDFIIGINKNNEAGTTKSNDRAPKTGTNGFLGGVIGGKVLLAPIAAAILVEQTASTENTTDNVAEISANLDLEIPLQLRPNFNRVYRIKNIADLKAEDVLFDFILTGQYSKLNVIKADGKVLTTYQAGGVGLMLSAKDKQTQNKDIQRGEETLDNARNQMDVYKRKELEDKARYYFFQGGLTRQEVNAKIAAYENPSAQSNAAQANNNIITQLISKFLSDFTITAAVKNLKADMQNTYRTDAERLDQLRYEMGFYQKQRENEVNKAEINSNENNSIQTPSLKKTSGFGSFIGEPVRK